MEGQHGVGQRVHRVAVPPQRERCAQGRPLRGALPHRRLEVAGVPTVESHEVHVRRLLQPLVVAVGVSERPDVVEHLLGLGAALEHHDGAVAARLGADRLFVSNSRADVALHPSGGDDVVAVEEDDALELIKESASMREAGVHGRGPVGRRALAGEVAVLSSGDDLRPPLHLVRKRVRGHERPGKRRDLVVVAIRRLAYHRGECPVTHPVHHRDKDTSNLSTRPLAGDKDNRRCSRADSDNASSKPLPSAPHLGTDWYHRQYQRPARRPNHQSK